MPVQVFRLRNVPDDEAQEIRNLLESNSIDYYETPAGNWGISMPAIWLHDDAQTEEAKRLIDEYQIQRSKNPHSQSDQPQSTLQDMVKLVFYIALAGVILYFSVKPFLDFGK